MANNLAGPRIADNQTSGHHRVANEALDKIDAAITNSMFIDVTDTNAFTLQVAYFQGAFRYVIQAGATSPTADFTVTITPSGYPRGLTVWRNTLTFNASVSITSQTEPAVVIPAGGVALIESDGYDLREVGAGGGGGGGGSGTFVDATSAHSAYQDFAEDTDNGTNKVRIKAPDAIASDATVNLPGASGDILSTGEAKNLTKGYTATCYNAGTKTSGTFTPDPANGNLQRAVNGGAHTLAPASVGSGDSVSLVVQYTNNGSAGTITTSGFTKVSGSFTTTNGDDFLCYITVINGFSHLNIVALQ